MLTVAIKFNGEGLCLLVRRLGCEVGEKTKNGFLFLTRVFLIPNSLNIVISFDLF